MEWTETMQIRCPFLQTHPRTLSAQNGISTTHLLDTGQTPYLCQTTVSCVPPALSYLSQIRIIHSSCQYFFRGRRDLFLKNTYNLLEAPVDINSVYNRKIHNLFSFFLAEIESTLQRCRNLPEVLRKKMSVVLMSEAKKKEGYSLGDLVHIRGKIKIFRGEREVVASYHSIL